MDSPGHYVDQDHDKHPAVIRVQLPRQVLALVLGFPDMFPVVEVRTGFRGYILEFFVVQVALHSPKILLVVMIGGAK